MKIIKNHFVDASNMVFKNLNETIKNEIQQTDKKLAST